MITLSDYELEKIEREHRVLLLQLYEKHLRDIRSSGSENED